MEKQSYESPMMEILEVAVEQGFAASDEQQNPSDWEDM